MSTDLEKQVMVKAEMWLNGGYDEASKEQIRDLIANDPKELTESFYRDLEFGTGGLRGIMGVGTNRMNIYTVGFATQGFVNYVKSAFPNEQIKVAIAYDSRNNSRLFAERVADIFVSNGAIAYLFNDLRPTPELSFAIRELGCHCGIVVTASHNPKEYNGYKAYWNDGAQVTAPHDTNIIDEVGKITSVDQVKTGLNAENVIMLDEKFDKIYIDKITSELRLSPNEVKENQDMKIVYTPIHGTGVTLVPAALKAFGFKNVMAVPEQSIPDGNFPTVKSPNPEERSAMKMAIDLATKENAELVIATDPDADRLGVAVKDANGEFILLNGNQTCVLLIYYLCRRWSDLGKINGKQYVIKTIVTSEMVVAIAKSFNVEYFDCLTGFKFIAKVIRENEGIKEYIGGGEESFGFLAGDFVRDKDAVSACALIAEAAAWAKSNGSSLLELLMKLYTEYGFYKEGLVSLVRKGKDGQEEIKQLMTDSRANPPKEICGSKVVYIKDYESSEMLDITTGVKSKIDLDSSNVLQFLTADGTIISIRPSGTEPKIKYYFGVKTDLCCVEKFAEQNAKLDAKIEQMKKELNLV